jgi:hypothetical protein
MKFHINLMLGIIINNNIIMALQAFVGPWPRFLVS